MSASALGVLARIITVQGSTTKGSDCGCKMNGESIIPKHDALAAMKNLTKTLQQHLPTAAPQCRLAGLHALHMDSQGVRHHVHVLRKALPARAPAFNYMLGLSQQI